METDTTEFVPDSRDLADRMSAEASGWKQHPVLSLVAQFGLLLALFLFLMAGIVSAFNLTVANPAAHGFGCKTECGSET